MESKIKRIPCYGHDDGDGMLFSEAVTRDFGENRTVELNDGNFLLASVLPLKCDPSGLKRMGSVIVAASPATTS